MNNKIKIAIIVATSENNIIGNNQKLLWHLPRDFKHFKETTDNHSIIMGRKTFESIGKPLPKRYNLVVTKNNPNDIKELPNLKIFNSIDEAILFGKRYATINNQDKIFIIGGGEIYKECLERELIDLIYLTKVNVNVDGDTYFPQIDKNEWSEIYQKHYKKNDENNLDFDIIILEKNEKQTK